MLRSLLIAGLLNVLAVGLVVAAEVNRTVDFERDIQPILASRCLACHGSGEAEAGLQLTDRDLATGELESGETAIVAGDADASALLMRVSADDESVRMPPEGPALTASQIELLTQWIKEGANWPPHWAYRPLKKPVPPAIANAEQQAWARGAIDRFVLAKLAEHKLSPSPPADNRTLLRRVYFDLIGLPPTSTELDAFVADNSPLAYERVVDRLLASPQYGERYARHWMDLVHFAETHGHDQDRPRDNAWPYRDFLIRSLNDDKPYSRFVQEQVAGDVLFPADPQAIAATGFLAAGPWDESSLRDIREDTLDREIARYLDRDDIVTTVMSTFVSSTAQCARCHDHKFDPIKQSDYYSLQAVFAATDKANRAFDADPNIAARRVELTKQLADLPQRIAANDASLVGGDVAKQIETWESELAQADGRWRPVVIDSVTSSGGSELVRVDDDSVRSGGNRPEKDTYTVIASAAERTIRGLRLELLTDDSLPHRGPGRQDNGNLHLNELTVFATIEGDAAGEREVKLARPTADFNQIGWSVEMALDGNAATAWGIYPEISKPHQAVFALAEPIATDKAVKLRIEMQQIHGGGHLIGRFRWSTTAQDPSLQNVVLSPEIAAILHVDRAARSDAQKIQLAGAFLKQKYENELATLPPQQMVYCGTSKFAADGSFRPSDKPRAVHVLKRGDITQPLAEVSAGALNCLDALPARLDIADTADEGQRRAALARWLTDDRNALTWRSIANRVWLYHFGRGLVDTPSDFGRMGAAPTHPELLDWLACELRDGGGSLKSLHRQIVTSATYRQASSHNAAAAAVDGDNHFLWRMNRRRLDAEQIHDTVLAVAGTLDDQMGGPSVKQFIQTPGVHVTPVVDYKNFSVDDPAMRRRSVYRFLFRTIPDPLMDALDCPDASQLTPRRTESITALQALATLNDKFIVRQCEHLASRIESSSIDNADDASRVRAGFREILARPPNDDELAAARGYVEKHGLANVCRMLVNSNEFMFVD